MFFILYSKTSYENQISTQYASEIFAKNKKNEKNRVLPVLQNRIEFGKLMEYLKGKKLSVYLNTDHIRLINLFNAGETFIEVGVQTGFFADRIIKTWPSLKKYYGIDLWRQQQNYIDGSNVDDTKQEKLMIGAVKLLKKYRKKIKLIRDFSNVAVKKFRDESIDFIYLDARHDFCGAYQDLILYYPKLKCNGIMAGHDYHTVEEVLKITKNKDDFGVCGNGTRVLLNGGAVKGIICIR
jgi:hypothetical protein